MNRNDIVIRIEECDECEDKPLVVAGYYNEERFYGRDIREEEYDELHEIVLEVQDIVMDMVEHEQAQG